MKLQTVARLTAASFTVCALAVGATPAAAQSTMTLSDSSATTLRAGSHASTNYSKQTIIETRASSDPSYRRRGLLKFDTHTTLPEGTKISSATLTLTLAGGGTLTRTLSAYNEYSSYDETVATWNNRKSGEKWSHAGGDMGARYDTASVGTAVGSKITFDVTALVQAVVRGDFNASSRYTRILLVDEGSPNGQSYKAIYSDEAASVANRPTLKITYGSSTTTTSGGGGSTSSSSSASGTTLRVLQWNTHHGGYGTDGKYDTNRLATWIVRMQPNVVLLNEIEKFTGWGNQNQPEVYKSLLESKTGKTWYYVFAQEFGDWSSAGKGNLILATVPLQTIDRHELVHNSDRSIAEAIINWGGRRITLISTHLDPDSATLRLTQATEVTTWAASEPENRILTGDMNAWPDQTSIAQFNKFYNDSWKVAASKGTAVAFSGNTGETKKGRIDYIFYSKGANLTVKSSQVYDTRDSNGVMPSDHRPVLTVFNVQ
jgi:endonuclease/exonuclease/phosphatase family metal-dependent hydrolase